MHLGKKEIEKIL